MENSMPQDEAPWYSQKVYARYWKHYNQAMEWMHRHKNAYRKAMESFYNQSFCPPENHPRVRYPDWDGKFWRTGPYSLYTQSIRPRCTPRPQPAPRNSRREAAERDSETDENSDDEEAIEYDLSNMEITEELRQYFEQTEKHREELPG